jgi:hypothetical protein
MKINNPEEILIRLILRRFGINAYDYSGMKQLALSINQKFGEKVSVNTLARIAGLDQIQENLICTHWICWRKQRHSTVIKHLKPMCARNHAFS